MICSMLSLTSITKALDSFFEVKKLEKDPAFSQFLPEAYNSVGIHWKSYFEEDFNKRFNGLMIRGDEKVNTVFASVFPSEEVLKNFIKQSQKGDFLFLHHPLDMSCGDPQGKKGTGFMPISEILLKKLKEKRLSVYSCHAPLDYHKKLSTSRAKAQAFHAQVVDTFYPYGNGDAGLICEIESLSTDELISKAKKIFDVPYIDFQGVKHECITKIAFVGGVCDKPSLMKEVESKEAQAVLSGEIYCRIDNEYGRNKTEEMKTYLKNTKLSLVGVSHAASEYLVMKTQMKKWFKEYCNTDCNLISLNKWW